MTTSKRINITLGTAGHIDHGKTALIKLLTGCETDRLKEEKARGLTIDLGYAPCTIAEEEVGIVDVPGHENFVRTMVAGAAGMDGCILVVAADDGVMPQTREHLDILTLLGVRRGLVALTKIDRVDAARREIVEGEVRGFLSGTFLEDAPILPVSSVTGEGFMEFFAGLKGLVRSIEPKSAEGPFRMPVDRAFTAKGIGTIVAGIPVAGSAKPEDTVVLLPQGIESPIRGIQVYGRDSDRVVAGQCAALQMRRWDREDIARGNVVARPGYFEPAEWAVGACRMLVRDGPGLKNGATLKLHTGAAEHVVRAYLLDGKVLKPGEEGCAQFHSETPFVVAPGDPFILRSNTPVQTIGGGTFLETQNHRLRRTRDEVRQHIRLLAEAVDSPESLMALTAREADGPLTAESLYRAAKVLPGRGEGMVKELVEAGTLRHLPGAALLHRETAENVEQSVRNALEHYHDRSPESPGMTFEELDEAAEVDRSLLDVCVRAMIDRGDVVEQKDRLALPGHESVFPPADRDDIETIEAAFRTAAFKPPSVDDVSAITGIAPERARRLVDLLIEHQHLVRIDPKIVMHRDAVETAKSRVVEHIEKEGKLESVDFKYLIDTTRKYAIPLIDYMDKIGVTKRVGNTRYLKRR